MQPEDRARIDQLLRRVRGAHPDLTLDGVSYFHGQFNDVLIVDDELVFRFPRSAHAARMLAIEIAVLRAIQPHVSLPVPEPEFGDASAAEPFVGYRLIPGVPLQRQDVAEIDDPSTLQRLADQLADFLRELHSIPLAQLGDDVSSRDGRAQWDEMYRDIRTRLFPLMRAGAREQVREHFEAYLASAVGFAYEPAIRHGDFGAGNILWNPETGDVTGVIDFSFAGIGDPAIDAAAISTFGEPFLERLYQRYPALATMIDRVRFYRGTYALKEALDGLRDGDPGAVERGLRQYR